jgi:pyocin large subunit-like protein
MSDELLNFANPQKLTNHFLKHSAEWEGKLTELDYLNKARSLLTSKVGGNILGFTSKEGTIFRYNKVLNEFATMKSNGVIETLLKPERGLKYYLDQVAKYGN